MLLYLAATQGPEAVHSRSVHQRDGLIARWIIGEAIAAAGELRYGRFSSAFKALFPGGADTLDDWRWDDPAAFFGQAAYYLDGFLRSRSLNPEIDGMLG